MRTRPPFTLIPSAALLACGGDTDLTSDIRVQTTDSAGVQIIEYLGVPETNPPFTIAEDPIYRHGANPGDYIFQFAESGRLTLFGGDSVARIVPVV